MPRKLTAPQCLFETVSYYERVVDPETEEVLRHCEEPLSEHFGRGSAKPR
jgi:phosphoribosylamine-glycine ligase